MLRAPDDSDRIEREQGREPPPRHPRIRDVLHLIAWGITAAPLTATLAVEAAFCNELRKQCSHLVPFLFGETNLHGADGMGVDIGLAPSWKGTLYGTPLMATLVVEAAFCNELRKQCRHLVPFLFGEANPNPNQRPTAQLRPTWLAIVTGRARPDEPEVVGGVQGW